MAVAVVTGANRGIGLELCRQLAERGDAVIAVCRKRSRALDALKGVRVEAGVDVSDDKSVEKLAKRLKGDRIDLLVNNAGILERGGLDGLDLASVERQLEVNAVGPLRVTAAFAPLLREGSKVAVVTSRMGSIHDNGSGSYYGYRMSKAAVNAAGKSLAIDLKPRGVAVILLHPGMVATEMTGGQGIDPADAARGLIARIDALTLETSGSFVHGQTGEVLPW